MFNSFVIELTKDSANSAIIGISLQDKLAAKIRALQDWHRAEHVFELQETPMARGGPDYAIWAILFRQVCQGCGGLGVVWDELPIISSETKKGTDLAFGLRDREVLNSLRCRGVLRHCQLCAPGRHM